MIKIRLASIEDSVNASIRELEDYIQKSKESLITAASKNTDSLRTSRTTEIRRNATVWIFQETNWRNII